MNNFKEKLFGGIIGFCIGDALGVPVEFKNRSYLKKNPIGDMIGYGTYNQPPGTWSDDSSLTFCLIESLINGYNIDDIGNKFVNWYTNNYWTPYGKVFDVGNATAKAIEKIINGISAYNSGNKDEYSNGNGSLMRILPLAYYYFVNQEKIDIFKIVKDVSSITHAHMRSVIACSLYVIFATALINGKEKEEALTVAIIEINKYYSNSNYYKELKYFNKIISKEILTYKENNIKTSGYVIDTLEAVIWSFMKSKSYKEAVLKAINLGADTDTTGAITGGLAGIYYKYNNLPKDWVDIIARKDDIFILLDKFYKLLIQ